MCTYTLKVKTAELTLTATPNTVGSASVVRIINTGTGASLITQQSNGVANVSFTLAPSEEAIVQKLPADTLTSANLTTCLATSIAFRD
jgi:hypothetical protein